MQGDVYGEPEIIKYKNIIANVYTPIISDEENQRRLELIKQAAIRLLLSEDKRKEK